MSVTLTSDLVAGLVVPWGVRSRPESTTGHRFLFAGPEALSVPDDATTVPLLLLHDDANPVGRAVRFEVRDDGLYGTFELDPLAGLARRRVAAGELRGLSAGIGSMAADCTCGLTQRRCACDVERGTVREVSLVANPAFDGADIRSTSFAEMAEPAFEVAVMGGDDPMGGGFAVGPRYRPPEPRIPRTVINMNEHRAELARMSMAAVHAEVEAKRAQFEARQAQLRDQAGEHHPAPLGLPPWTDQDEARWQRRKAEERVAERATFEAEQERLAFRREMEHVGCPRPGCPECYQQQLARDARDREARERAAEAMED